MDIGVHNNYNGGVGNFVGGDEMEVISILLLIGLYVLVYWCGRWSERNRIRNKMQQIHDKYHGGDKQEDVDDRIGG